MSLMDADAVFNSPVMCKVFTGVCIHAPRWLHLEGDHGAATVHADVP